VISSSNQSNSYQELDTLISKYIKIESDLKKSTNPGALGRRKRESLLIAHDTDIFKILYSEYEKNHQMLPRHGYDLNKKNESDFKDNFCTLDSETNDIALNAVITRYQDLFKPYQGSSSLVPVKQNSVDPVLSIIKENPPKLPKKSSSNHGDNWFAPFSDPLNQLFASLSQISQATTGKNFLSHSSDVISGALSSFRNFSSEFEKPPQWSQNSSAPNLHQHDWLNSVVNQSTSFVTSLSGVFAPEKLEPSTKGDEDIKEQMQQRIKESLAKRLTASPKTKPNSHEEAISAATIATQLAINAGAKARSLSSSFASTPTKRPPSPQLRSQTYNSQHSAILSRADSVVKAPTTSSSKILTSPKATPPISDLKRKRPYEEETAPASHPRQPLSADNYSRVAVFAVSKNSPASRHVAAGSKNSAIKSDLLPTGNQKKLKTR
jgi:hypothetical protein